MVHRHPKERRKNQHTGIQNGGTFILSWNVRTGKPACLWLSQCCLNFWRPLQWSQSSVIFSAHPSEPFVIARHFSSFKQFTIPSPKPVASNQTLYQPPTVISIAPADDWLFAYFPKYNGEGTGCLWKRGLQIDNWTVQEWWPFPPRTAPVTTEWLGAPREVSRAHIPPL